MQTSTAIPTLLNGVLARVQRQGAANEPVTAVNWPATAQKLLALTRRAWRL